MPFGKHPFARTVVVLFLATLVCFLFSNASHAAATPTQKKQVEDLTNRVQKAGQLFSEQKFKESAKEIEIIQRVYTKLAETEDAELLELLSPLYGRLIKAHARLELEGFDMPRLRKPEPWDLNRSSPSDGVSFVKQVAPLLVAKCGRCHVDGARGEFTMATYAQLMKGSSSGVVIFPGDDQSSRFIEVLESGDMPRGGGKLSAEEVGLLKRWVKGGAKYDGKDPQVGLRTLAPTTVPAEPEAVAVMTSTGKETVSFASDIAPVLLANCSGCHVNVRQARANLNMTTFAGLLRGGNGGPPVKPGKPEESLIVQRIKGEGGEARMPLMRDPLSDAVIAMIEKWISEGATYDGGDSNLEIGQVAALAKAQASTHEALTAERAQLAENNWRLGMPNIEFTKTETKNFLLLGNVGEEMLSELGKKIEAIQPRIAGLFNIPTDKPMVKGRMTIFVFRQRYDYAEFGQMVEKRQLPTEWRGHWRYTIVDAYGAIIPAREDEYSFEALAAQQIAGTYVASLGKNVPRWFAEGSARVMASRVGTRDRRVIAWENELSSVLGSMTQPDDFLTGKLTPEHADIAAYSFVKFLIKNGGAYFALLNALRNGQDFDKAFLAIYKGTPAQVAGFWLPAAAKTVKHKR